MSHTIKLKNWTSTGSGKCGTCGGTFLLRRDGMVRYHGPHPRPCPGGGKPPVDDQSEGRT